MAVEPPSIEARLAMIAPTSRVYRRVDIFESDGDTPWYEDAPFTDGGVTVDQARDERRMLDLTLDNREGDLSNHPEGLWYDKVIKPYRGVWYQLGDQYGVLVKSKGPSAYWRMSSVVNSADESGNGVPLDDVAGDPRVVGALISSHDRTTAVRFDPTAAVARMGSGTFGAPHPLRHLDGGYSLEAWIVVSAMPADFGMFLARGTSGHYFAVRPGGSIEVSSDIDSNQESLIANAGLQSGRRYHVVAVVTANRLRVYVEGELVGERVVGGSAITTWDTTTPYTVGARPNDQYFFDGIVDEVAIYNRPLSAASVQENYNRGRQAGYSEALWSTQLGEFQIDDIDSPRFPRQIKLRGRDFAKKLILDKFPTATLFDEGVPIEDVVQAVALNGGISKLNLPSTGQVTPLDLMYERGTPRWEVIKKLCTDYGWELYFDASGFLTMREFRDPVSSPTSFEFETGPGGTMVEFGKKVNDTRIKNHVIVSGENADQVPVFAEVENNSVTSPTRIERLGRRSWEYVSQYITEYSQALSIAENFISVQALESFEVNIDSLVLPWLEVGEIIRFDDPEPNPGDPNRYLLDNLNIPLTLGPMGSVGKRVTIIG